MEESKDCIVDIIIDILFRRKRKKRKIFGEGEFLVREFSNAAPREAPTTETLLPDAMKLLQLLAG